jgi:DNA-directed RNA polymerase subunit M/transcription elongation factor TFIIS
MEEPVKDKRKIGFGVLVAALKHGSSANAAIGADTQRTVCIIIEKGIYNKAIDDVLAAGFKNDWNTQEFIEIYSEHIYRIAAELRHEAVAAAVASMSAPVAFKLAAMPTECINAAAVRQEMAIIELRNEQKVDKKYSTSVLCRNCGSARVEFREVQIRAADEPATIKYSCDDCGKRWSK